VDPHKYYLVNELYSVDYSQGFGLLKSNFKAQLSFTLLDWLIVDRLVAHREFSIAHIDRE
jgi:hypothetical protein